MDRKDWELLFAVKLVFLGFESTLIEGCSEQSVSMLYYIGVRFVYLPTLLIRAPLEMLSVSVMVRETLE